MGVATGVFQLPDGSAVASGRYQWKLSNDAIELGSLCCAPMLIGGFLDANGNMTSTFVFNDQLTTAFGTNTTYQLTIKDLGGRQVWNENYFLTGTAANLNLVAPGSGPSGPVLVPVLPDSFQSMSSSQSVGFTTGINTFIEATAGAAGITLTLPNAAAFAGRKITFLMVDTGAGGVTLAGTVNGVSNYVLTNQWQSVTLESNGSGWRVVATAG